MRPELLSLVLAVLLFENITEISTAREYAVRADNEGLTNFCRLVGCRFVEKVTSEYSLIRCPDRRRRSIFETSREDDIVLNTAKKYPNMIKEIEFQELRKHYTKSNDPKWNEMWNLNGQVLPSMKVKEAWSMGRSGSGVTVAVVDNGVQWNHPDLRKNIDITKSFNVNKNNSDPSPTSSKDSHGTEVTGILAAEANNSQCIVGVAHQSTVIGIKFLTGPGEPDGMTGKSLKYRCEDVDIYTNSWGARDGSGYFKLGIVTKSALLDGIRDGRSGKGSIYVWAAGNGGLRDNCNADGYVNSIYTIPITSVDADGKAADYAEVCAPVFAATYSGNGHKDLISTSLSSSCVGGLQGTSFSAPQAAGMIALALETNPSLTWRDVQHLVVETSKRHNLRDGHSNWQRNGAGFYVSQVLGFGLMDAEALVTRAKTWVSVPHQLYCFSSDMFLIQSRNYLPEVRRTINTKDDCEISSLEHVIVTVSIPFSGKRGNVVVILESPAGTRSELMTPRPSDSDSNSFGLISWNFSSVHFWGEKVEGIWILTAKSEDISSTQVKIKSWKLHFYGFRKDLSRVFFEPISVTQLTSEDHFYRNRNENGISGSIFLLFLGVTFVIIVAKYTELSNRKKVFLIVMTVNLVYQLLNYQQI